MSTQQEIISISESIVSNPSFLELVMLLNQELAERDGKDHAFYTQFNDVATLDHVVVAKFRNETAGCGALRKVDEKSVEIKRMFVKPAFRKNGIAKAILTELESYARELGFTRCVLETGKNQPEAIALYSRNGYRIIPNYGPYEGVSNSICFEKLI
jgi:putative acetyltransferase